MLGCGRERRADRSWCVWHSMATLLIGLGAIIAGYSTLSANVIGFTFVGINNVLTALSLTLVRCVHRIVLATRHFSHSCMPLSPRHTDTPLQRCHGMSACDFAP